VPLPLVGVTATVPAPVRIDSLEPFVTDLLMPQILFHAGLTQLLSELDTWPEPQTNHHYDGLTALHLLWYVAITRGMGKYEIQTTPRAGSSGGGRDEDDFGSSSRRMF
jgi:hypothetical protein